MKALVYHGPGKRAWEDKPRPAIQHPSDAIVRVTTTTICGTDLHILKGKAYDTFGDAAAQGALKVVVTK